MKVLQFTIPVAHDKSVIVQEEDMPHFYPHLHRHKEAQVTWIQQGEGTLIAGNNMHAFKAGEVYFIGADQPHLFKSNPEYFQTESKLSIKALTVFFDPNGAMAPMFELPEMKAFKDFILQHKLGFKLPPEYVAKISRAMLDIKSSKGSDQLIQFLQMMRILSSMPVKPGHLSDFGLSQSINEAEGIRISNIYNYILQHYARAITLDDVAREACMTPQAFCRYFKKHTRHTFVSFLNEMRINEACKKLTGNKYESISVVAYKCGFSSITNFNRVFKSVMGSSPREYLDRYANKVSML
ncbi:AraC family transcriptional regulator [Mucilaginibacter sp.]|jgi:AraC-like DNA-binding protein|uniref:AraC family transcriptional regulator n=1 Tax=Mucilaginibacter sp. TaxID=1882438 RepID=UPI002B8C07E9|nr:AraC family transcriptional regulator [Mucilaginibacter sp.]HTI58356.1 AraC family transcriptional regulator [Mucilaginibacter sp.]